MGGGDRRRSRQGVEHRQMPISFDRGVRGHGMGRHSRDCATGPRFAGDGAYVARAGRGALHGRMRVLSLEGASVPSSGVAPFRPFRFSLPLFLHSLARVVDCGTV